MASPPVFSPPDAYSSAIISEDRVELIQQELKALEEAFLAEPSLQQIPSTPLSSEQSPLAQPRRHLAPYIEGQRDTLTSLEKRLIEAFYGPDEPLGFDVKVLVCDIAIRKHYGPRPGNEELDLLPYEDVSRGPYWFWELRSMNLLPETLKQKAAADRRKHKQMQERLLALSAIMRLSENAQKSKMTVAFMNNAQKAIERLERVPDLQSIYGSFKDTTETESAREVCRTKKREVSMNDSLTSKRESKRRNRASTPPGFGNTKTYKMSQKLFRNFFETTISAQPSEEEHVFLLAGTRILSCPADKRMTYLRGNDSVMDAQLDAELSEEQAKHEFLSWTESVRERTNRFHSVMYGAPSTWARRPSFSFSFEAEAEKQFGSEWSKLELYTERMKYLWFSSDSECPPYDGPFPKIHGVSPRNPFTRVPGLDYDELFDEGWEPEPEGESISCDQDDDDDKNILSDEDAAFVVADDHLSDDEGIGAERDTDETESNMSIEADDTEITQGIQTEANLSQNERLLTQSIRSGKTMIFTQLSVTNRLSRDWMKGDPTLLEQLRILPLTEERICIGK